MPAKGFKTVTLREKVIEEIRDYYEKNKEDLEDEYRVRSFSDFLNFILDQYLEKEKKR
ncbi:MAG: hypothetical protein HYY67_05895 [Thaumarchaeota archaeon]|jgi:hypothetical protein|nr:hypothetical protein [Nitrososphaerota archaeon]